MEPRKAEGRHHPPSTWTGDGVTHVRWVGGPTRPRETEGGVDPARRRGPTTSRIVNAVTTARRDGDVETVERGYRSRATEGVDERGPSAT